MLLRATKRAYLTGMFHDSIPNVKIDRHANPGSGVGWKFTILVAADRVQASPNLRAPKTEYRKYSPSPDFMLVPSCNVSKDKGEGVGFCPILLGEVISNRKESDRWRMLLQLAVCARVNGVIAGASRSPLVVQAVYLTDDYVAERYLAYADIGKLVGCEPDFIKLDLVDSSLDRFKKISICLYHKGCVRSRNSRRCHQVPPLHVQLQRRCDGC